MKPAAISYMQTCTEAAGRTFNIEICQNQITIKIVSEYDQEIPQSRYTRKTSKQSNQLSPPHQDDCKTRTDMK